jgi:Flavin containing amine oxidoreductase
MIKRWAATHAEFRAALKVGKEAADQRVERSLSKPARDANDGEEVAKEALAEIRCHIQAEQGIDLSIDNIAGHYLDSDIIFDPHILKSVTGLMPAVDFARSLRTLSERLEERNILMVRQNLEPLFINTVGSWRYRPNELTDISNLMLASDYLRTNTDLATMEGANESGRRAVNRILDLLHVSGRRCRIFEFDEPMVFAPLKAFDRYCFELGLPHSAVRPWRGY